MSGMFARGGGDIVSLIPPIQKSGGALIELSGVYKTEVARGFSEYCATGKVNGCEVVLPESSLRSKLVAALVDSEVEVSTLPKRGGSPSQSTVLLAFEDINAALSLIKQKTQPDTRPGFEHNLA